MQRDVVRRGGTHCAEVTRRGSGPLEIRSNSKTLCRGQSKQTGRARGPACVPERGLAAAELLRYVRTRYFCAEF